MKNKIKGIIDKFPALKGKDDFIKGIIDIREAFNLKRVPFCIKIGSWSSGSLDQYYKTEAIKREEDRKKKIKAERKKSGFKRKGLPGWKKY